MGPGSGARTIISDIEQPSARLDTPSYSYFGSPGVQPPLHPDALGAGLMHASIWRFKGDPDDLLRRYDAVVAEIPRNDWKPAIPCTAVCRVSEGERLQAGRNSGLGLETSPRLEAYRRTEPPHPAPSC